MHSGECNRPKQVNGQNPGHVIDEEDYVTAETISLIP